MKKLFIVVLILFVGVCYGQGRIVGLHRLQPEYITVTCDSTDSTTIYVSFPPASGINSSHRTAISATAFTSASAQAIHQDFVATGDVYISVVTDTSTIEESDSMFAYIKPYFYDATKATWYAVNADKGYLVFDTAGTYIQSTVDYLDWTHGSGYGACLSNELWPCSGFTLTIGQRTYNNAGAASTFYVGIWICQ